MDDSRLGKLTYQYDAIGRLTQSQSLHQTESFAFDPAGNLIDPIATHASQIKSNLISQYKGKNYKYDAQGNVIETNHAGKTLKLTWDNLNRLVRCDHQGQVTEYGYDVFGRRLFKKNQTAQTLTLFGWDGDLMIWESQQSNNADENYTKHYVYEAKSFVPLLQTGYTGFIKLIETPDYSKFQREPYSIYKDPVWKTETRKNKAELERVAFYHCDQVGTPQTLSNERGECVWEIVQDTWGNTQQIRASDNLLEQSNIRFQGQYYDVETGLHYNRYRYYEPYSGRYVSKDPIGLMGGLNNSAYVSDPNQWVDPMGLIVHIVFNKSNGTIKGSDLDSKETIGINGVFTGGYASVDHMTQQVTNLSLDESQAIPRGRYWIIPHEGEGKEHWYKLYAVDMHTDDFTYDFNNKKMRGYFRLHPGTYSTGCVTIPSSMGAKNGNVKWDKLSSFIQKTNKHKALVFKGGDLESKRKFGHKPDFVDLYGILDVE